MLPKDISTVRVSELPHGIHKEDLQDFFVRNSLFAVGEISLCPCKNTERAQLVGTVTFSSSSEAKKALDLNGQVLQKSRILIERDFMGFTVLSDPNDPSIDIIAVHGLNGHAYGTWASLSEGKATGEVMWLRDFLPNQTPSARIIVVKDFATDLLQRIVDDRGTDVGRPLIFICHSLGGLVVKQALVLAHRDTSRFSEVFAATRSVMFFGTPHKGSKAAGIGISISNVASLAFHRPPKQLLQTLKLNSSVVLHLLDEFNAIRSSFTIISLYERRTTPMLNTLVVDENSSCLGDDEEIRIPLDATHNQMCKFSNPSDHLLSLVFQQIKGCLENDKRSTLRKDVAASPQSQNDADPSLHIQRQGLFLVPTSPSPYFEGRKEELQKLEILLNQGKQPGHSEHCPIVAVHGLGGIGKTQLATQYVYNRKAQKTKSCTFWVSASSEQELQTGLESICEKLALDPTCHPKLKMARPGVSLLKAWMTLPDSGDWLLVLDNYDDISVKLDDFLPTEAVGSVLITSRDRKIIGSVAKSGFSLAALNEPDARHLFLRLSSPIADVVSEAPELISEIQSLDDTLRELQYFPLAIDQAASFIRENSPMTVGEYLSYLKPRSLDRERLLRFKQARPEYPESVMTTWEISLEYLNKTNPRASWILQFLGFLSCDNISEELLFYSAKSRPWAIGLKFNFENKTLPEDLQRKLTYLKNDVGFREAIGTLTSLSLIRRNAKTRELSVHPLVHEWIRVRLNAIPQYQANWTVVAALVLFQTFPCEICISPSSSWDINRSDYDLSLVIHHVESLLENLRDYRERLEELPLECYILCETLFLTASSQQFNMHFYRIYRLRESLSHITMSILKSLPSNIRQIALFIHRLNVWVRKDGKRKGSDRTKLDMADALRKLDLTFNFENLNILFLMLLTQAIVDVTLCEDDFDSRMSFGLIQEARGVEAFEARADQRRASNSRLLLALQHLFETLRECREIPLLVEVIHFFVKLHLMNWITREDFMRCEFLHPSQLLDLKMLTYLSFNETGEHFCRLAQLLWNYDGPKDYESIKMLFSIVSRHWNFILMTEHRRAMEEAAENSSMAQSVSTFISSSFGRSGTDRLERLENLETPLDYIWEITQAVAIDIANGNIQWTTRQGLHTRLESSTFTLGLNERKSGEDLVVRMSQLYSKIGALGHSELDTRTQLKARFFETDDLNYTLIRIYIATEQWYKAQHLLTDWLQCRNILDYYDRRHKGSTRPWYRESDFNSTRTSAAKAAFSGRLEYISSEEEERAEMEKQGYQRIGEWDIPQSCDCIVKLKVDDVIHALLNVATAQDHLSSEEQTDLTQKLAEFRIDPHSDKSRLGRLEVIYRIAQFYREDLAPRTSAIPILKARGSSSSQEPDSDEEKKRWLSLDSLSISSDEEPDLEW